MTEKQQKNKELVDKYPFLYPRDWYGKPLESYDYSFTELDDLPEGWVQAFGETMCEEIKQELLRCNCLDDFVILQTKEKFGTLRLYYCGVPRECHIDEIIEKYEKVSAVTCAHCGKPATKISTGWICPWCDDCAKDINSKLVPIEEYYNKNFLSIGHTIIKGKTEEE